MRDIFEVGNDPGELDHVAWGSLLVLEAEAQQKSRRICDKSPYESSKLSLELYFCIRRKNDKMRYQE